MLGEPPGSPEPPPLVRSADKALRAFPEAGCLAAGALHSRVNPPVGSAPWTATGGAGTSSSCGPRRGTRWSSVQEIHRGREPRSRTESGATSSARSHAHRFRAIVAPARISCLPDDSNGRLSNTGVRPPSGRLQRLCATETRASEPRPCVLRNRLVVDVVLDGVLVGERVDLLRVGEGVVDLDERVPLVR